MYYVAECNGMDTEIFHGDRAPEDILNDYLNDQIGNGQIDSITRTGRTTIVKWITTPEDKDYPTEEFEYYLTEKAELYD